MSAPGPARRSVGRAAEVAAGIADWITQVLLTGTVVIVFGVVVCRRLFGFTPKWGEEIALRFIIWFSFLGASLATRYGLHLAVELFANALPERPRRVVGHVADGIVIAFGVFMVVAGSGLVASTADQTLSATKLSVGYTSYLAIPVSGALIVLQALAAALGVGAADRGVGAVADVAGAGGGEP